MAKMKPTTTKFHPFVSLALQSVLAIETQQLTIENKIM